MRIFVKFRFDNSDRKNNMVKYSRTKSPLTHFPPALEHSVNTILFQIKVFNGKIDETTLEMYLIK